QEKEKGQVPKEKGSAKDNDTGNPFHVDEVVSSKNSFANLMEEDSGLDEGQNVSSPVNADGNDKGMKDGTTVVKKYIKSQHQDSLWEKFKANNRVAN
nr:hypothetical protein [Tanacetum cinerariifolium]